MEDNNFSNRAIFRNFSWMSIVGLLSGGLAALVAIFVAIDNYDYHNSTLISYCIVYFLFLNLPAGIISLNFRKRALGFLDEDKRAPSIVFSVIHLALGIESMALGISFLLVSLPLIYI
jgi:hypothetical protein